MYNNIQMLHINTLNRIETANTQLISEWLAILVLIQSFFLYELQISCAIDNWFYVMASVFGENGKKDDFKTNEN